jgi:eukaryotic-like serine/threonine-protein kinase
MQGGLAEIRRILREEEPAKPSTRLSTMTADDLSAVAKRRRAEALKLTSLIRGDLDWIVMKCLEKDRSRRYETASGLAADVQRHLRNELVLARPASPLYRLRKLVRRNKLIVTAAGAVLAGLLMGLLLAAWLVLHASHTKPEQRDPTINLIGNP